MAPPHPGAPPAAFRPIGAAGALALALAFFLAAAAGPAPGAEPDSDLSMTVEAGLEGVHRAGRWAPIRVEVKNQGPDFAGEIQAVPAAAKGGGDPFILPVQIPRFSRKEFRLHALLPAMGRVEVTLRGGGRKEEARLDLLPAEEGTVILVSGRDLPQTDGIHGISDPPARVAAPRADALPGSWIGYDAADLVVLASAGPNSFARPRQEEAFETWVRGGGRAVIVADQGGAAIEGTVFERIIPARLGGRRTIGPLEGLGALAGQEVPRQAVPVSRVAGRRGEILAMERDLPLAIRGSHGLGEVVLLTFDPFARPFAGWPGMGPFWRAVCAGRPGLPAAAAPGRGAAPAGAFLEGFPVAPPVAFGTLCLIFAAYGLLLGPVEWWVLRRAGRPGAMWATLPLWALLFGTAVYGVSMNGRGKAVSLRTLTVVDADAASGAFRSRTYGALFSPFAGRFDLSGPGRNAFLRHEPPPHRLEPEPGAAGELSRGSGRIMEERGAALSEVFLRSASMSHFSMDHAGGRNEPLPIRARWEGGTLVVQNETGFDLTDLALIGRGGDRQDLGDVAAGKTLRAPVPGPPRPGAAPPPPGGFESYARKALPGLRADLAGGILGPGGGLLPPEAARLPPGRLESNGRMLLATARAAPFPIAVGPPGRESLDICLYRIFFR